MNPEYLTDPVYVRAWAIELLAPHSERFGSLLDDADAIAQFVMNGAPAVEPAQ